MEHTTRQIIDALEDKYGSSRAAAQAIGISFGLYLHWLTSPEAVPTNAKRMMAFRAGLLGRNVELIQMVA